MVKKDAAALLFGKKPTSELFGALFASIISLIFLLLVGEYLWNNVLVKVVTFVKPVTSMWQILGLYILLALLFH
jgi:hypothetical protein